MFKLNDLILKLFVFVAQLLDLLRFKLLAGYLRLRYFQLSDLQQKFVLLLLKAVNFLDQGNIFFHYLVVLLRVELCVLFERNSHVL